MRKDPYLKTLESWYEPWYEPLIVMLGTGLTFLCIAVIVSLVLPKKDGDTELIQGLTLASRGFEPGEKECLVADVWPNGLSKKSYRLTARPEDFQQSNLPEVGQRFLLYKPDGRKISFRIEDGQLTLLAQTRLITTNQR